MDGRGRRLDDLTPAALHLLECADGELRHSRGMRALGALGALAQLAPQRMAKPGFPEKLDAARHGARAAIEECRTFFHTPLPPDVCIEDVFPAERHKVLDGLAALDALSLDALPGAIAQVQEALRGITVAVGEQRRVAGEFVRGLAPQLAGQCEAEGVRLVTSVWPAGSKPVFLDPARLGTAIAELVTNALKHAFNGEQGTVRIEVGAGASDNEILLAVADDGHGIPESRRAGLFVRGESETSSGEGLAVVKQIVEEEHLGTLQLTTSDAGTRWEILLPVKIPREKIRDHLRQQATATARPEAPECPPQQWAGAPARSRRLVATFAVVGLVVLVAAVAAIVLPRSRRAPQRPPAPEADLSPDITAPPSAPLGGPTEPEPGRAPAGTEPVGGCGRHASTGWAREIVHIPTGIHLVFVPAGKFRMGTDEGPASEGPARQVTLAKPFYIAKTEVSQAQYEKLMGENPSRVKGSDLPVHNVSYMDCLLFCGKAGLRLPTEAEWEYAARTARPAPAEADRPRPVGGSRPNRLGLHEVLGNVAEWCSDWYDLYPPGDAVDPRGPERGQRRVIRGGSYLSDPSQLRPTMRSSLPPTERRDFVGFRVALDIGPGPAQE